MKAVRQTTLRSCAELSGTGVHSGLPVSITIHPAPADTGIVFVRSGADGCEREVRAEPQALIAAEYASVLGDAEGPVVATVEHVMAALFGLGVDNAVVEIDGPEIPIMDGSAAPFADAISAAGVVSLGAARRYLKVLKPVGVQSGASYGELRPYERGFRLDIEIDFAHPVVGRQEFGVDLDPVAFRRDIARARTFGFTRDVARLWSDGYALGASFENTLVVGEDRVLNPEGARYVDEFVRHKALDAIGDLALAGMPILGAYRSVRGGHRLNHAVLCALLADPTAWTVVEGHASSTRKPIGAEAGRREPAVAVAAAAARRSRGHADIGMAQPAFAPDLS